MKIQEKRLVSFQPLNNELEAIESFSKPYRDNFKLANYLISGEGRRILIVSDRISKEDFEHSEILAGDEATTFENVVNHALKETKGIAVKEIVVFNWEFARVQTSGNKNKADLANKSKADDVFYMRFRRFVKRYRPDVIVLSGIEMFEFVISKLTRDYETKHKITFNRIKKYKIGDQKVHIIGTLDYLRMCSWDQKYTKDFPFMLGFFSQALQTAIIGKNRYTAKILPDKIKFNYVDNIEKFKKFYAKLIKQDVVGIDTEGLNLARIHNKLFTAQFAWKRNSAYLVPIDHPETPFSPKEIAYIKSKLKRYFEFGKSKFHIYQNGKFDLSVFFSQLDIRFYNHRVYDISAGEYALDENRKLLKNYGFTKPYGPYSLGLICEHYGIDIYRKIEFSKGDRGNIAQEGLTSRFIEYGCYDVIVLLWIVKFQLKEAKRRNHKMFLKFVAEQLSDTTHAFSVMELTGAPIDKKHLWYLRSADGPIEKAIQDAKRDFRKSEAAKKVNYYLQRKKGIPTGASLWGDTVWLFDPNKNEHKQLLMFKALKLEPLKELKNGDGQINKLFLEKYKDVPDVALYNTLKKNETIRDNTLAGIYKKLSDDIDCRHDYHIRSSYDYTDVVTARSSSKYPNLQNIPSHGPLAKPIKKLFIASPGCLIVENDYSAHEVRDWGNESGDAAIAAAFYKGLKYRQELRIAAYENDDAVLEWTKIKAENNWNAIKGDKKLSGKEKFEKLQSITKVIKKNGVKFIATIELDIEVFGDVHKLNCERFFKVSVLEVTDTQRQGVKAVVFGVIYGKGAASLGESLKETEEYAQNLIDTMFREFRKGGEWIEGIHEFGQEHLYVASPLGMHRHLWGYLHSRKAVQNAMNRRGPNTIIQGMASNIGVSSIRIMQKLAWNFFVKYDVPYWWKSTNNYVHDSVKGQTPIHTVPLYLYLIEHASTTLIHERYRKLYGYNLTVGLELEFAIGADLSRTKKWDFMRNSLFDQLEQEVDYCIKDLGYKIDKDRELKGAKKNWEIISDLRKRELKEAVKSNKPSEVMLMTEENARSIGLQIWDIKSKNPKYYRSN